MTPSLSNGRIYPIPVKPPSHIATWSGWPSEVRAVLYKWNHERRLSFKRFGRNTFKCDGCGSFCLSHTHGAAVIDGAPFCDDCLIVKARVEGGVPA